MKLLALCVYALVTCVPSAPGAGCSPLSCGVSQVPLSHGRLLVLQPRGTNYAVRVVDLRTGRTRWRLPAGIVGGHTLVHLDGTLFTWFDAATGARLGDRVAQVRGRFALTGVSQDGRRAVLSRTERRRTTLEIVSPSSERRVVLGGNRWQFDALNGGKLFLLQWLAHGYVVRLYDLASNRLAAQPLKDADEDAVLTGVPWQRVASPDGRYLLTLYLASSGKAMIHRLDTVAGTATCIDLPGDGDFNGASSYSLAYAGDGRTVWALSPGYGRVAAVDVPAGRVRDSFSFAATPTQNVPLSVVAVSNDATRAAIASRGRVWMLSLRERRVLSTSRRAVVALAFSPDGRDLWALGQRSRITPLPFG